MELFLNPPFISTGEITRNFRGTPEIVSGWISRPHSEPIVLSVIQPDVLISVPDAG